jgi:uncharacterized protein YdiU (UPF0061 family)
MPLTFDNRLIRELPGDPLHSPRSRQVRQAIWSPAPATPVSAPQLLAWSPEMAATLGITPEELHSEPFVQALAGNTLLPGMVPYATRYGGHQFGHWAGQLGDGRAIYLGEVRNPTGQRFELQLKGAGPTPYSRNADGRAVLRSSLREFLCSEAMFHLGVPTTRALTLIGTGDEVIRDILYQGDPAPEPGAIVCRVAPSFLRFGHFEILAASGETELLAQLVDFAIARDYPELEGDTPAKRQRWFTEICRRTALMVAHWMRVGFVHGVMNTDNMSTLGLTIDYGPYGWVDNFDPGWTPNTTDRQHRRYRFGQQPQIAYWNLSCLASALGELFTDPEPLEEGMELYPQAFAETHQGFTVAKFGFSQWGPAEEELVTRAYTLMQRSEVDMTLFFRQLAHLDREEPSLEHLHPAFYNEENYQRDQASWQRWVTEYVAVLPSDPVTLGQHRTQMNAVNPVYVLRNYLAQEAIDLAEQGDLSRIEQLQQALRHPYQERTGLDAFMAKRPDWARNRPGCSMLSCSS